MRIKSGLLFLLILTGSTVFAADAIIHRTPVRERSAIEYSNYSQNGYSDGTYYLEVMIPAVNELENKIKQEPYNYPLYVNLADIYIKAKQYDSAFDDLVLLYNLKKNNKLDNKTISLINKVFNTHKRTVRKDSILSFDLAVLALILEDESAIEYAIDGVERSSNSEITKKMLDMIVDSNQNPAKAINVCEQILAKNSRDIEVRKIKAEYHKKLKQPKEAIGEYVKILDIKPSDDETRYNLYVLLANQGGIDDKEMLRRLYSTNDNLDYESRYISLTELLLKHSDFGDAKYYAANLVKKYGQNPNGYILMADIYKREGKIKDAYDVLNKARDKADSDEDIAKYNVMLAKLSDEPVREANSLIANQLYEQALEVLKSANPESLYVILTQARANYLLGNKQDTFELLNKAMSLYKDNSDVYCAFGYIYLQEKDSETARNYANQSLKINPDNATAKDLMRLINSSDSKRYVPDILNAMEAQNYDEAMRLVDEAIEIDKNSADLYYYKSLIFISSNNYRAAAASLYKCLELDRNYTDAYFYMGTAYDNIGDKTSALKYYKNYLDLVRGNSIGASEKIEYAKNRIMKLEG